MTTSNLNPEAKEFVFNPNDTVFQPTYPQQVQTPHQPLTQSPVIQPLLPVMPHMYLQPIIFQTGPMCYQIQQQERKPHKRVRPDWPIPTNTAHTRYQTYQHPQPVLIGSHSGQSNQQLAGRLDSSQSHPQMSNTPKQHNPYQQMSLQGYASLLPSPQNSASPQTVHMPALQYQLTSHTHPLQMQGTGNQMMSQAYPSTSATYKIPSQHMQQQLMMVPHPPGLYNQQSHQFQQQNIVPEVACQHRIKQIFNIPHELMHKDAFSV